MSFLDGWADPSAAAGVLTEADMRGFAWDLEHRPYCVLYVEDGTVTECVTHGSVRP